MEVQNVLKGLILVACVTVLANPGRFKAEEVAGARKVLDQIGPEVLAAAGVEG